MSSDTPAADTQGTPAGAPATPPAEAPPEPPSEAPSEAPAAPLAESPARESTPASLREENVATSPLTALEIDALFASQYSPAAGSGAGRAGSTAVMGESDMDALYRTLAGYPDDYSAQSYLPAWAKGPPPRRPSYAAPVRGYAIDDVYDDAFETDTERLTAVYQAVRELEVSIATIDDTTIDVRDRVGKLGEDVKALRTQLYDTEEALRAQRAQNAALTEEVRELRYGMNALRGQFATLIHHLAQARAAPADHA